MIYFLTIHLFYILLPYSCHCDLLLSPPPCSPSTRGASCCAPTHTKPLKRIIYIAQVWDQSIFCETLEYTNLRSDFFFFFLLKARNTESHRERERIKHGLATTFHPSLIPSYFSFLLIFKEPVRSHPAHAGLGATTFRHKPWTDRRIFSVALLDFLWSFVSSWAIAEMNIHPNP